MKKTEKKLHDFWDERYRQEDFVYGEQPNEYLKTKLSNIPVGKALFPAEGEGRNAVFASELGFVVSAFDQSEVGKKKAELLAKKKRIEINYIVSDVENVHYPENSFDVLVLIYAHFHTNHRRDYHRNLSSFLKKGGVLIMEEFSKFQIKNQQENPNSGGPKDINMLYDLEEIKLDFNEFEFKEVKESTIKLNEGNYHSGKASVIRIIAIKK